MLVIEKSTNKILGNCQAQVTGQSYTVTPEHGQPIVFPLVSIAWGDTPDKIQTIPALQADNIQQAEQYLPVFLPYVKPDMS